MIEIMFDISFAVGRTRKLKAGQTVFRQGTPSLLLHRLKNGWVRLARSLPDGTHVTVAVAGPGESFAEAALFSARYHCDAIAETDCEIETISIKIVRQKLANDPNFAKELAAYFARQVRDLRARLEIRNIKLAPERLLAWLRMTASGNPPAVKLERPWVMIAAEIGLTPEATYRASAELKRRHKIVRLGRRSLQLHSKTT